MAHVTRSERRHLNAHRTRSARGEPESDGLTNTANGRSRGAPGWRSPSRTGYRIPTRNANRRPWVDPINTLNTGWGWGWYGSDQQETGGPIPQNENATRRPASSSRRRFHHGPDGREERRG